MAKLTPKISLIASTLNFQLRQMNMKSIPPQIADELADLLRTVDLSHNKLRLLPDGPDFLPRFTMLKQLHLAHNLLTALPDEIGCLRTLEVLNVAGNQLTALPSSLAGCGQLKQLLAASNKFTSFPQVLCELRQEPELVDLAGNLVEDLPPAIENFRSAELNLGQNRLRSLHPNLARCGKLRTLRLDENCLQKEAFTPEILADSNVSLFTYAGNLFQESDFQGLRGYDVYQKRYTATRMKRG